MSGKSMNDTDEDASSLVKVRPFPTYIRIGGGGGEFESPLLPWSPFVLR